jgi:4-aminobutyrate aminotransferase-like enzyme
MATMTHDPKTAKTAIGPKIKTALPGPNAKRVLEDDQKYISPSYTRSYPLVAKSGRGIVVTDVDGNEFFDPPESRWFPPVTAIPM